MHLNIFGLWSWKDCTIRVCDECKESVRAHYVTDGKFTPPNHVVKHHVIPRISRPTTRLTMLNKCTSLPIHCSQVPYTFWPQGSAQCLVSTVRLSPDKSTSWQMKLETAGKEPTLWLADCITSSRTMVLERRKCTYTLITVLVKTRTIAWCNILSGEYLPAGIRPSFFLFWLLGKVFPRLVFWVI